MLTIEYRLKSRIIPTVRSTNEPPKKCFLCDGEPKCVKHCPAAAIRYVPWMDRTGDEPRQSIHGYLPQENRDQCSICHR